MTPVAARRPLLPVQDQTMARSPAILQKPLQKECAAAVSPAAAVSTPPMQEKPRAAFLTPSRYEPYAGDAYEHVDVIGRGAFGLVTKMRCRADGGLVAMKTVDRSRLHTAYLQKTAHREARTLRRLGAHPHIVALREVIECDRSIHIVLELVDGCTVAELCGRAADGRLSTADAATIAAQALAALAHCHAHRVCHRDVKADNLLVDPARLDGSVKLIDFGIAAVWREDGAPLTRADGATAYMAPERVARRPYQGAPVDAWALGVVVATMLTGALPFQGASEAELRDNILGGRRNLGPPGLLSPSCLNFLGKLLAPEPSERLSAAAAAGHPWLQYPS